MRFALTLLTACVLAAPTIATEPAIEDWDISRYEWTGEIAAGSGVAISNPHGDLRVRDGAETEVYVLAVIQRHNDDPRRAQVKTELVEGTLRVEVTYAATGETAETPEEIPAAWTRRRVDLTVFVPEKARTEASTEHGLVELRGLAGDVEARSVRGEIKVRIAGLFKAHNRHGSVFAQLRRADWQGTAEIETLTGDIRVELPRGEAADVELETRGEITTDYSIEIHRQENSLLKKGIAKADDASRLLLKSNRGAIRLIESNVPAKTAAAKKAASSQEPTKTPTHP